MTDTVVTVESDETPAPETVAPVVVPVTTVVDTSTDDDANDDTDTVDLAVLVGALAAKVDTLLERQTVTEVIAADASDTADAALDVAVEAVAEPEPEPEEDDEPESLHWVHRRNPFHGDAD